MLVYTNTAVLAYDLSVIRSLFPSCCTTTCLCGCTLIPLFWPMIRITVALYNDPIVCSACSPSLWHPMHLCRGGHHHHFSIWTVWSLVLVTVACSMIRRWYTIEPWCMRRIVVVLSVCFAIGECYGGDDKTDNDLYIRWWELDPVFTIYLLIQMGFNNLLNTHTIQI
jgi:hypothetical protein